MKTILMFVAALALSVNLFAQTGSGVPAPDRAAFLQGQMDAQQAATTGNTLASYCEGWRTVIYSEAELFRHQVGLRTVFPTECQQFWSYADIYGPTFWYPQVYTSIRVSFGRSFGRYRRYDTRERIPFVGRPYSRGGEGRQQGHSRKGR